MWFWKVGNACSILGRVNLTFSSLKKTLVLIYCIIYFIEHISLVTFFDKQWDYIFYSAYIGWVFLIGLSIISQIHYLQVFYLEQLKKYLVKIAKL